MCTRFLTCEAVNFLLDRKHYQHILTSVANRYFFPRSCEHYTVSITARIASIFVSSNAVHIYDIQTGIYFIRMIILIRQPLSSKTVVRRIFKVSLSKRDTKFPVVFEPFIYVLFFVSFSSSFYYCHDQPRLFQRRSVEYKRALSNVISVEKSDYSQNLTSYEITKS